MYSERYEEWKAGEMGDWARKDTYSHIKNTRLGDFGDVLAVADLVEGVQLHMRSVPVRL